MSSGYYVTKWHKELDIFHKVKPILILEGNVLDQFQYPSDGSISDLNGYLVSYLMEHGYQNIVSFDSIHGFYSLLGTEALQNFKKISGCRASIREEYMAVPFAAEEGETAPGVIERALSQNEELTAVILNLASRYVTSPDNLSQAEVNSYTTLLQMAAKIPDCQIQTEEETEEPQFAKNILLMLVDKTNDLPTWFCLNNPNVKILHLSTPGKEERAAFVKGEAFESFFKKEIYESGMKDFQLSEAERQELSEEEAEKLAARRRQELEKIQDKFVGMTEGFTFLELNDLRALCHNEGIPIAKMYEVVDLYRYGIRENPWTREDLQSSLREAQNNFYKRVKGQEDAITKTMDVVKRAATGMSGLQHSSHTKPKGILFFAGPTGTGKTETAKTLAEILFGDENRCIRFDMSEYSQPQSDQKLLGAPPGYVGYEAGGQLTNAVRENPFSILLFDEIEKAHGSIFDKFLQILEDGRMTDGQGKTVYFSETIIIFTSNLGMFRQENGEKVDNVTPEENYSQISQKVKTAIEDYFKYELGRPEILNRIGENIVVFDFIRPDTARLILDSQIEKIITSLRVEKNIRLTISEQARETLFKKACANLKNGGRGIGNVVEDALINPLSRFLFDEGITADSEIEIQEILAEQSLVQMKAVRQ